MSSRRTFKQVAIIIPCYNEAASIATVISKFPRDKLMAHGIKLRIFVIDNNSSDNTAKIARKAGAKVTYEPQKGKGNALRTAFKNLPSNIDYVAMLDGDDTYSPEEIMRLLEPLESDFCDVVVGSRLGGNIQTASMTTLNRLGNVVFTAAARILYGANITDVLTGYFAWKKSALDELSPHITSSGFAIEMEMITKMARLGHRLTSVPISYHPRAGESSLHPFKDGFRILMMLLNTFTWFPQKAQKQATATPRKMVFVSDAIYPYMKGGKEKRLHEITKRLAAMGHDVHIYTMHWWKEPAKTRIENGVHLHALCNYYEMYHGNRRTIKEGIIFGLSCLKLFFVSFDVLDVDHMPFFPIFSSWLVCSLRGRKLYATWHEALSRREWMHYMGQSGRIAAAIERLSTQLPHSITAASAHTRELLGLLHGRVQRVELVASGIDTTLLKSTKQAHRRRGVLYVGRLVKDKNVGKLIDAMALVVQQIPKARCTIIGQGLERERLEQEVRRHGLQDHITFLGMLPEATDVYAHMKSARVFCTPSTREGFGITTLEALGCGTPVVTIDSPANAARHLVQDGQNGSVVQLNEKAIADAIVHWLSAGKRPRTLTRVSEWDWHQLAQKQVEVYSS